MISLSKTTRSSTPVTATRHPFLVSAITSQAAGLIMAVVIMLVFTVFLGKGPIYPVQVIGSIVYGESALNGFHLGAFLAGLVAHQLVALAWGLVFAVIIAQFNIVSVTKATVIGVAVAVVSMVDTYALVPAAMLNLHGVDIWNREVPLFWNWAAHIVYGLSFGLYPIISNRLLKK